MSRSLGPAARLSTDPASSTNPWREAGVGVGVKVGVRMRVRVRVEKPGLEQ